MLGASLAQGMYNSLPFFYSVSLAKMWSNGSDFPFWLIKVSAGTFMVGSNSLHLLCVPFLCVCNTHSASKLLQTTARKMLKFETTLAERLKKLHLVFQNLCKLQLEFSVWVYTNNKRAITQRICEAHDNLAT